MLRGSLWRGAFRKVLLAERYKVMEASLLSDEPTKQAAGAHIVRWLDDFLQRGDELERRYQAERAQQSGPDGSPWMEPDSGAGDPDRLDS